MKTIIAAFSLVLATACLPDKLQEMPAPTPPATNFPWAPDTNYPAGADPWSAQPTKVDAVDDMVTPGRSFPATNFNKMMNDRDVFMSAINNYVSDASSVETSGSVTPPTPGVFAIAKTHTISVTAGDLVMFWVNARWTVDGAGGEPTAYVEILDPDTTTHIQEYTQDVGDNSVGVIHTYKASGAHLAIGTGTLTVRVYLASTGGGVLATMQNTCITAMRIGQ